jgi:hypothetical protein
MMDVAIENNLWTSLKRVVILFPYRDEQYYRTFRAQLDRMLNESKVEKLEIIVLLPKEVKKEELPPHRLIHFISPKDFNLFGKLKGDLLYSVLSKDHDALLTFLNDDRKMDAALKTLKTKYRIGVNSQTGSFDIDLKGKDMDPAELVNFAKNTLQKLSTDE